MPVNLKAELLSLRLRVHSDREEVYDRGVLLDPV